MTITTTVRNDAVIALGWSSAIERTSTTLPRRRGIVRRGRRSFYYQNRVAFAEALNLDDAFPASGVFVNPNSGASLLRTDQCDTVLSPSSADVVMAGMMRTADRLRFRAFYLVNRDIDTTLSLSVQQRAQPTVATPLVAGTRVQASLQGQTSFVVPKVVEVGSAGRLPGSGAADWVVEEALDGAPVLTEDTAEVADQLVDGLAAMWVRMGVTHAALDPDACARARAAFTRLVNDAPEGVWPPDVSRHSLERRAQTALDGKRPVTIGMTHGDPGVGNALRLRDGRLALIDWEYAGRRAVAHDILKVVKSTPDPRASTAMLNAPEGLRAPMAAAGAMPWRHQVAVALLLFLRGWRSRHDRAVQRGSVGPNIRRMYAMLHVLDQLLDA